MLRKEDFANLPVVELNINLWAYWSLLSKRKNWNFLHVYINWNLFYIERKWPTDFVRFNFLYEKIKRNDEEFEPGAPANETIYYNFLKN